MPVAPAVGNVAHVLLTVIMYFSAPTGGTTAASVAPGAMRRSCAITWSGVPGSWTSRVPEAFASIRRGAWTVAPRVRCSWSIPRRPGTPTWTGRTSRRSWPNTWSEDGSWSVC